MINVFLSASLPLPERDSRFFETVDVLLAREAIKALVVTLIEVKGRLVFGGHPAITPLVAMLFDEFGFDPREHVTLYQSSYFQGLFPLDNTRFGSVIRTPAARGREESLLMMRQRMLNDVPFHKGVFVGGMEGVLEEFRMFRDIYGVSNAISLGSTGAAARVICDENPEVSRSFLTELTYLTLFRNEFSKLLRG